MYKNCSKSLATHAAEVFHTMTGHKPSKVEILTTSTNETEHHFTIGERVEFQGKDRKGLNVKGFFICAFETMDAALRFSQDISTYLGLTTSNTKGEADNYIGEFLNVVIGLTCSAWADHGLRVDFNPPEKLQEHSIDKAPLSGHFFQVIIEASSFYKTTLFLHFQPEST
ncbi:MAG: hypothetical protein LBE38_08175 [Deltaproteobacteria bacterium]|jgi:CheY-specific phosphatase CheX|nr:hypothetical protein [Deltaproteobacteria bacterium]